MIKYFDENDIAALIADKYRVNLEDVKLIDCVGKKDSDKLHVLFSVDDKEETCKWHTQITLGGATEIATECGAKLMYNSDNLAASFCCNCGKRIYRRDSDPKYTCKNCAHNVSDYKCQYANDCIKADSFESIPTHWKEKTHEVN